MRGVGCSEGRVGTGLCAGRCRVLSGCNRACQIVSASRAVSEEEEEKEEEEAEGEGDDEEEEE